MPFLPEEARVNPGCCGAELAWWLSRKLTAKGVADRWHVFLDARSRGLFRRKRADLENARPLPSALEAILAESERIFDLHWK